MNRCQIELVREHPDTQELSHFTSIRVQQPTRMGTIIRPAIYAWRIVIVTNTFDSIQLLCLSVLLCQAFKLIFKWYWPSSRRTKSPRKSNLSRSRYGIVDSITHTSASDVQPICQVLIMPHTPQWGLWLRLRSTIASAFKVYLYSNDGEWSNVYYDIRAWSEPNLWDTVDIGYIAEKRRGRSYHWYPQACYFQIASYSKGNILVTSR